MLNFNLFENIDLHFKCFCKPKTKEFEEDVDKDLVHMAMKYNILILPVTSDYEINNLYPVTDQVHLWNIFIVGSDKTYIMANINDDHIRIPNYHGLVNHKSENIISDELTEFFNNIWSKSLNGFQLQFCMIWNSKTYLVNTYPFLNPKKTIIGAIMFMRSFDLLPESNRTSYDFGYPLAGRLSHDIKRVLT